MKAATLALALWTSFERPDGTPLVAPFGGPRPSAPQYDVQAARKQVPRIQSAPTRWGPRRDVATAAVMAAAPAPLLGAPIDAVQFRYARPIAATADGLNALSLDAAVLAGSRDLSDLRISDHEGRQVPYLLEKLDEPLSIKLPALERLSAEKGVMDISRYRVRLPYARLPDARLVLSTPARVFRRSVALLIDRSREDGAQPEEEEIGRMEWTHAEPETAASSLVFSVPRFQAPQLILSVDEGDNTTLPLEPPELLLPSYRLRFFAASGQRLRLLYGGSDLPFPRYDLALLAPRLVGVAAHEVTLSSANAGPSTLEEAPHQKLFWAILVTAVLVFLALIRRLMRKGSTPTTPQP